MTLNYKYIFGPVPSRRFGRSLGVDLVQFKTCSLDCIFCQIGTTTLNTVERREFVPIEEVLNELEAWNKNGGRADCITLSGSGEPTLHSRFGDVLAFIKKNNSVPGVLLSNGTLFTLPEVRRSASQAAIVKVALSAWDQASFERINRPCPGLQLDKMVDGYKKFRSEFDGELRLEVFLLKGINSSPDDVLKIAALAHGIGVDRIQLNTAVRPPAHQSALAVSVAEMNELAKLFDHVAEVVGEHEFERGTGCAVDEKQILVMLKRHPCTVNQIADTLNLDVDAVSKCVDELTCTGMIRSENRNGKIYYA